MAKNLGDADLSLLMDSDNERMKNVLSEDVQSVSKRKVFWQPLGYVPAKLRMSGGVSREQEADEGSNGSGSLLRYG